MRMMNNQQPELRAERDGMSTEKEEEVERVDRGTGLTERIPLSAAVERVAVGCNIGPRKARELLLSGQEMATVGYVYRMARSLHAKS